MANTNLQNCQRITILMQLFIIVVATTFQTIRLIKKKIDLKGSVQKDEQPPSESAAQKYKQSEITHQQFDKAAVKSTILADTDTCTERLMKKICEFNLTFNPLLLVLPLSFILGKSMPFQVSMFFISIICCFLFNIFKIHRAFLEIKIGRFFFQIIWSISSILILVNLLMGEPSSMLYLLKQ